MKNVNLSVSIIAKNEEDRLPKTLKAIKDIADEIIVVVDSSTTDKTAEIARKYGAKVFIENWKGYGKQKQSALNKTQGKWILFLDADEVVDDTLKKEIKKIVNSKDTKFNGYLIKRKMIYLGKPLKHIWKEDLSLRLVRREANPRWIGDIHEKLEIDGKIGIIEKGYLLHYSYRSLKDHLEKTINYAYLSALDFYKKRKKFSFLKLIFNPMWTFFKAYILKRGCLDGIRGLIISFSYFVNAFCKYAFLWYFYFKEREESSIKENKR